LNDVHVLKLLPEKIVKKKDIGMVKVGFKNIDQSEVEYFYFNKLILVQMIYFHKKLNLKETTNYILDSFIDETLIKVDKQEKIIDYQIKFSLNEKYSNSDSHLTTNDMITEEDEFDDEKIKKMDSLENIILELNSENTYNNEIIIESKDIDKDSFLVIMNYLYGNKINLKQLFDDNSNNNNQCLISILTTLTKLNLQLDDKNLKKKIINMIKIEENNLFDLMVFSIKNKVKPLKEKTIYHFLKNKEYYMKLFKKNEQNLEKKNYDLLSEFLHDISNHNFYKYFNENNDFLYDDDKNSINYIFNLSISEYLKYLFDTRKYFDVILETSDMKYVKSHKLILISFSDYFDTMLNGNFNESKNDIIKLNNITSSQLNFILEFIYTDEIKDIESLDHVSLISLIIQCDLYMLNDLKSYLLNLLIKIINDKNSFDIIKFCCEYNLSDELKDKSVSIFNQINKWELLKTVINSQINQRKEINELNELIDSKNRFINEFKCLNDKRINFLLNYLGKKN
jgi:hypothetical protein